jgi:DNA (cytosine-5)-methyltransferase 1
MCKHTKNKSIYLTHASLFSGIGGFELAAEWTGIKNIFHCDNNDFCRQAIE